MPPERQDRPAGEPGGQETTGRTSGISVRQADDGRGEANRAASNGSGPIKRVRRTKDQMAELRRRVRAIVEASQPCSVRHVYYEGIGVLWPKDDGTTKRRHYKRVVHILGEMREYGMIPFSWITDDTRYCRIPTMHESLDGGLEDFRESYRRDLWATQPTRLEVWVESDSIRGTVDPVTQALGVGCFSCRGQASKTFAYSSAMTYLNVGKPVVILYIGDFDPTGLAIPRSLRERLGRYAEDSVPIVFSRLALSQEDVLSGELVTHHVNPKDPNYPAYADECRRIGLDPRSALEVEALPAPALRTRLETALYDSVEDVEAWNDAIDGQDADERHLAAMSAAGWSA